MDPRRSARTVVAAIPARFHSTRLPGKVLRLLAGRPVVEHVFDRVRSAQGLTRVVVLTDDRRVQEAVEAFGGEVQMTPADCASGTDRIAWAAKDWPEAAVINIQGDEPLIDPADVSRLASHLIDHPEDPIATFAAPADDEALDDPHVVKVVLGRDGRALYFSRSPIPFRRNPGGSVPYRHIGIYGYQRDALLELTQLPQSPLELTESLEQLRALENGMPIRVLMTRRAMPGVDTMQDLERLERLLEAQQETPSDLHHDMSGGD